MVRRNEFAEAVSAIFAIIVFFIIGGVLFQSLEEQANVFGNLAGLFGILMAIVFFAVIVKLIKSFIDALT